MNQWSLDQYTSSQILDGETIISKVQISVHSPFFKHMAAQVLCFWIDVSTPQILGKVVDFPYITFKLKCSMWDIMASLQFKLFT